MAKPGVRLVKDNLPKLYHALNVLPQSDVLVGVPAEKAERSDGSKINNAEIAYIQNYGAPEAGIPQREFMRTGILKEKEKIIRYFRQAGDAALEGDKGKIERALNAAGMTAQNSIRNVIRDGIPPALAESTLKARARLAKQKKGVAISKGAKKQLETGVVSTTPLIVTGGLLKSLTYVLRRNKRIPSLKKPNDSGLFDRAPGTKFRGSVKSTVSEVEAVVEEAGEAGLML